jgi:hypothetical protein
MFLKIIGTTKRCGHFLCDVDASSWIVGASMTFEKKIVVQWIEGTTN